MRLRELAEFTLMAMLSIEELTNSISVSLKSERCPSSITPSASPSNKNGMM
jgi:hypothetical protein